MTRRAMLMGAAVLLAGSTSAWALKLLIEVTPSNLAAGGFKVKADRDGDKVKFVVERDLKKSTWPKRSGYLSLPKDGGKSRSVVVNPAEKDGVQTYRFAVAADQVAAAEFTITEVQTANGEPDGEELIGGGTYYRFRLADFTRSR